MFGNKEKLRENIEISKDQLSRATEETFQNVLLILEIRTGVDS